MLIILILIIPLIIIGLILQVLGHTFCSIGYICWGDTWSAKHIWSDLLEDIKDLWNGR